MQQLEQVLCQDGAHGLRSLGKKEEEKEPIKRKIKLSRIMHGKIAGSAVDSHNTATVVQYEGRLRDPTINVHSHTDPRRNGKDN